MTSVEAFIADNVAALTRPFACDGATLQALAPPDRAAVGEYVLTGE
jgi:hypothetical protein